MKALKITPDGEMAAVAITGENIEQQNECIYQHLGGFFTVVRLGEDAVMLVDDDGLLKSLPVNAMASMIADYPFLVGTALIVGIDVMADGEQAFGSCPARFLRFADKIRELRGSSS